MTYLDGARLLLSLMVTSHPTEAKEAVTDFGHLVCSKIERYAPEHHSSTRTSQAFLFPEPEFVLGGSQPFAEEHRLEDAIAETIRILAEDNEQDYFRRASFQLNEQVSNLNIRLAVRTTELQARLELPGAIYSYEDKAMVAFVKARIQQERGNVVQALLTEDEIDDLELASSELTAKYRRAMRCTIECNQPVLQQIAKLIK